MLGYWGRVQQETSQLQEYGRKISVIFISLFNWSIIGKECVKDENKC